MSFGRKLVVEMTVFGERVDLSLCGSDDKVDQWR